MKIIFLIKLKCNFFQFFPGSFFLIPKFYLVLELFKELKVVFNLVTTILILLE